jgi:hypothetical protein
VDAGYCYRYQYLVTDNVGNQTVVTGGNVVTVVPAYAAAVDGTSGLTNWWRLGDTSNTAAAAKGSVAGTYTGNPTRGVTGAVAGDSNTAVQFGGTNYALLNSSTSLASTFSIEFWFRSTQGLGTSSSSTWTDGAGLVTGYASSSNRVGVSLRADGRLMAGVGTSAANTIIPTSGVWNDGSWHHVVFTRTNTGKKLELYVDGESVVSKSNTATMSGISPTFSFGRVATSASAGTNYLAGALDEVAIYSTALDADTVAAHYLAGVTP